jgi:phosphate transport system permease protein
MWSSGGISAWNWVDFFSKLPTPAGIPGGGIWNAIVGSLIIDGIAAAVAIPFGIACGLFLAESDGPIVRTVRFATDVLSGVPSIILGIFAYIIWSSAWALLCRRRQLRYRGSHAAHHHPGQ